MIIGDDLVPNDEGDSLVGNIDACCDPTLRRGKENFDQYVRNIYRVLLSRGMKGCYVYFVNKDTERFFNNRIETDSEVEELDATGPRHIIPYENSLPLLDLRAAADGDYEFMSGHFSEGSYEFIEVKGGPFPEDRFLVRVDGDSMEPLIPDGALCLFRRDPGGSRNGKIVLCQIVNFAGGAPAAVIKTYRSARAPTADSIGEAQHIVLSSINPLHDPIVLTEGDEFSILGLFDRVVEEQP